MKLRIGSASPWGRVNHLQQITEGIAWVSTPSHGGIKLSAEVNRQMPAAFKVAGGWYEEDCEASKVIAVFPDHFDPKDVDAAIRGLKNWYPVEYELWSGNKVALEESLVLREERFLEVNFDKFLVCAAWGDWLKDVPKGMVGVCARLNNSTGTEKYFLVPAEEYAGRQHQFVIDTDRHQEIEAIVR